MEFPDDEETFAMQEQVCATATVNKQPVYVVAMCDNWFVYHPSKLKLLEWMMDFGIMHC